MIYTETVSPAFNPRKAKRACVRCGRSITRLQARRTACDECREIIHRESEAKRQRDRKHRIVKDRPCQHPGCVETFQSTVGNRKFCSTHMHKEAAIRPLWDKGSSEARVLHVTPMRPVTHDYTNTGVCPSCGRKVPDLPFYLAGTPVVCAACSDRREEYPR